MVKGIHPGAILKRELEKIGMPSIKLAEHIKEHKQTISAILNGRRGITPLLSIKLSREFNVEPDYFMLLQASYEVEEAAAKVMVPGPDPSLFRKVLFWDTDISRLNWQKSKRAIIQRILERGNEQEIKGMIDFYGIDTVRTQAARVPHSFLPSFKVNVEKYLG